MYPGVCLGLMKMRGKDILMRGRLWNPMWADNCENVAFNTYPAAVMPDFKGLRYLTAPNMVVSDSKNHAPGIENEGPYLMMNPFSSRCCQHNHAQGWPYYAEHLWMATPDNGVAAILYAESKVTLKVGTKKNQTITLQQTGMVRTGHCGHQWESHAQRSRRREIFFTDQRMEIGGLH